MARRTIDLGYTGKTAVVESKAADAVQFHESSGFAREAVTQLRGLAGERQISTALLLAKD